MLFGFLRVWAYQWKDSNGVTWLFTLSGSNATIVGTDFTNGNITIPSTVYNNSTAYTVTSIGDGVFLECTGLTKVTIPDGIINIGKRSFMNCSNLKSINIPSSVESIGASAFFGCFGLTKVIVPDISAWCNIHFDFDDDYNNSDYDDYPDENNAKFFASPLYYAHYLYSDENTEIIDLIIPENVSLVNWGTFYGCSELKSVTVSEGITDIAWYSFANCSSLTNIILPSSITFIDDGAFQYCSNVKTVKVYKETPISIMSDTFSNYESAKLYVPEGCKAAYESAEFWQDFSEIIEMNSLDIPRTISTDGSNVQKSENGTWYTLDGRLLGGKPTQKGIYILDGKKRMEK